MTKKNSIVRAFIATTLPDEMFLAVQRDKRE